MDSLFNERLVIQSGAVAINGQVLAIALEYEKAQLKIPHAHIIMFVTEEWKLITSVDYDCVRIAWKGGVSSYWVVLGVTGEILYIDINCLVTESRIYPETKPGKMGLMRSIRAIGDSIFAVGMRRQIFLDQGGFGKIDISEEIIDWPKPGAVVGFESIDGFSEEEVYAVGWEGEIAWCQNKRWQCAPSPTNLVLTGVACGGNGLVYVCGQRGILIRGRENQWEVIDFSGTKEDFWDVIWYKNKLYVSSLRSIYTLIDNTLHRVDMGDATTMSCYHLSVCGSFMCSVGSRAIGVFNGEKWLAIPIP